MLLIRAMMLMMMLVIIVYTDGGGLDEGDNDDHGDGEDHQDDGDGDDDNVEIDGHVAIIRQAMMIVTNHVLIDVGMTSSSNRIVNVRTCGVGEWARTTTTNGQTATVDDRCVVSNTQLVFVHSALLAQPDYECGPSNHFSIRTLARRSVSSHITMFRCLCCRLCSCLVAPHFHYYA